MSTTDIEQAAESLLAPEEPVEAQEPEQEESPEAPLEEATEEDTAEAEAEEVEATEADEDDAEDAGSQPPDRLTVKVNGEDVEVTLEDLKRSFSGNAYIQKGMQEAAEAKKQAQAILEALHTEQQRFTEFAQRVQTDGLRSPPKAPDPSLAATDPIGYVEARARYDADAAAYNQQQAELQRYTQAQRAVTAQQRQAYLAEQKRILSERIPDLADPQKAVAVKEGLRKTAQSYGFTEAELDAVEDARTVQVLHDAYQWRQLQAAKAKAKTAAPPPKNVKPAGKRPEPPQLARARAIEQARKSGRLSDFADLLFE